MSQHDMDVANANGSTVRGDINNALQALASNGSGAAAPATTFAYQFWADTTNGVLKQRNAANSVWIIRAPLAETRVLAKSAATTVALADYGCLIKATGTWSLAFTAAATLGDGFWFEVQNVSTGSITLDPNSTEQIDGATTATLGPGQSCKVVCDASGFYTVGRTITSPSLASAQNLQGRTNSASPNSKVDVTVDNALLIDSSGNAKLFAAVSVTADITAAGANGLDTGSEASNTTYRVWLVGKSDGTIAALLSTSATAPTMPSGYTYKMLVGAVRNDGSSNFIAYRQRGRKVFFEAPPTALSSGTATAETAIALSTWVPAEAQEIALEVQASAGDAGTAGIVTLRVISGSRFATVNVEPSGDTRESLVLNIPNVSQQVYYLWSSALTGRGVDVYVAGFEYSILAG